MTDTDQQRISPTPRWDIARHVDVAVHAAIADLTVQVARIANVLEYTMANIEPNRFPDTTNEIINPTGGAH